MKWINPLALLWVLVCGHALASTESDQQAVAQSMKQVFDRPDALLQVEPVTVRGDYAISGWTQLDRGGRALLKRKGSDWGVVICAGDGLLDDATLRDAGLPAEQVRQLLLAVRDAEARQPSERVRRFALFQGTVQVDPQHGHAPASTEHGQTHSH